MAAITNIFPYIYKSFLQHTSVKILKVLHTFMLVCFNIIFVVRNMLQFKVKLNIIWITWSVSSWQRYIGVICQRDGAWMCTLLSINCWQHLASGFVVSIHQKKLWSKNSHFFKKKDYTIYNKRHEIIINYLITEQKS